MTPPHATAAWHGDRAACPGAGPMARLAASALGLISALLLPGVAQADPGNEAESLRRHGAVSRLLWVPTGSSASLYGGNLSAGLALGTRGPIRAALGPVAPALVFETGRRTNLTLMVASSRGAMLVWQRKE